MNITTEPPSILHLILIHKKHFILQFLVIVVQKWCTKLAGVQYKSQAWFKSNSQVQHVTAHGLKSLFLHALDPTTDSSVAKTLSVLDQLHKALNIYCKLSVFLTVSSKYKNTPNAKLQ